MSSFREPFRIGTRGSVLALAQTGIVRALLQTTYPDLQIEVVRITTKGDLILDRPLAAVGDKGLFVAEIEDALQSRRIDCAVHSAKDLPSELADGMTLTAFLERADPRDVLVTRDNAVTIDTLRPRARVGTGSPRRVCQLRAGRADLDIHDIRGNVDTRLRKLAAGEYDALVLAAAGLDRLGIRDFNVTRLDPEIMLPAVGQGAIAIETASVNTRAQQLLAPLNHAATSIAVHLEREFLRAAGGGCHAAMGAYVTVPGSAETFETASEDAGSTNAVTKSQIYIRGMIGTTDGTLARSSRSLPANSKFADALTAVRVLVDDLRAMPGLAHGSTAS